MKPSNDAIARAFWRVTEYIDLKSDQRYILDVVVAEAAGPALPNDGVRDWPEDSAHENGNYHCKCCHCGGAFIGHKRRVTCKFCAAHTIPEKATTSAEHAHIPQENVHIPPDGKVACPIPTCRAELMPGQHCKGPECGLRK